MACLLGALGAETRAQPADGEAGAEPRNDAVDITDGLRADEPRALPDVPGSQQDGLPQDEATVADDVPPPVSRLETLLEVNRLANENRHDAAQQFLPQLIRLTEQEFGAESAEAAEAYIRAAQIEREATDYQQAEQHYLRAVDIVRAVDGTYSRRAIEPLVGLGDSYQLAGEYLNAITAYNEARTVSRRVDGLLNEGQIPILDRITDSFEALDQYADADEHQLAILHLAERNHPQASPEHLEAIYRYAKWLRESGRFHDERLRYAQATRLIRDAHGRESLLLVRPLRETANSFRAQRLPENQGINALRTALELLDAQLGASPLLRAEVLRDLGDWDVAFSKVDPNLDPYLTAWELLGELEDGAAVRAEWFEPLTSVYDEPVSQRGLSRAPDAQAGHVIVAFHVDRLGRTSNVRIAQSEPAGFKDDAVIRAISRWRFRPLLEDGQVMARDNVALRINFRYLPDEQAAASQ